MKRIYIGTIAKFGILLLMVLFGTKAIFAQWTINEGFESGAIPSNWTIYDENDDGEQWGTLQHNYAHSGDWLATVQCFGNDGDDWLITPRVTIQNGDVFTFFARAWYGTEDMKVRLSTTGKKKNNFNVILENVTGLGSSYQEFTYDLSAYSGQQVYLAIQWLQDTYSLVLDDVKVGQPQSSDVGVVSIESPLGFNLIGTEIIPACTVKNFGASELTDDFPVGCNIRNAENTLVYSETLTFTGDLQPSETGQVSFPSWLVADTGSYTITMFTNLPGDGDPANDTLVETTAIVLHYGIGGPDLMGYRWIDSNEPDGPEYNWIEISTTGTSVVTYGVNAFEGDDNFSEPIPIGFDFPFYGIDRSYFHADINGELLLAENRWYKPFPEDGWDNDGNVFNYHAPIPGYEEMPALIAVFWDDLFAEENTGDIYYQMFGNAPERYGVIQWNNLRFLSGNGGSQTLCFEVILHENGDIIMQYKNVDNGQSGGTIPHVFGQSATVAIQNDDATAGLAYLREIVENNQYLGFEPPGNLLHNELAIKFYLGEDNEPPLISHEQVWNTFNDSQELSATITDVSGILSDTLYYNTGSGWQAISHSSFEEPNIYHYFLDGLPAGASVEYYFVATDNSPNANRAELHETQGEPLGFNTLPTAGTNILLAMPGNRPGFQDYKNEEFPKYLAALDAAGVNYDVFNWAAFDQYSFPDSYDIIFAYSNSTRNSSIHDTLSKALINFMDSGTEAMPKNVFMAADNLPSVQHALPSTRIIKKFFTAYLRGGYNPQPNPPYYGGPDGIAGPDLLGYYEGSMIGLSGSPIGTEGLEIPVYADDPDVIYNRECPSWYADEVSNPEISSWGSFAFEDGPFSGDAYSKGNGCALWLDNLIYKSFFISFDISQLSNDSDINTLIQEVLDWFTPDIILPPWTYTITGQTHTINVPATADLNIFGEALVPGDWVGVFFIDENANEVCGGAGEISPFGNAVVTAYGNDATTPEKDGFAAGETFRWRIFDSSEETEYPAGATYDEAMPNQGNFADFGLSKLTSLEVMYCQSYNFAQGWNSISSYISPFDADVEILFAPIVDELTIMRNLSSVYWPGENINTIGNFDNNSAYALKVAEEVNFDICGIEFADKELTLAQGWHYLPVLSECEVNTMNLFGDYLDDIVIIQDLIGTGVFWPAMNVYSLENLDPGKAYKIKVVNEFTVTFPECTDKSSIKSTGRTNSLTTPWGNLKMSPATQATAILHSALNDFIPGDVIGTFGQNDQLYGYLEIKGKNQNQAITLFGDDASSIVKDGFAEGEAVVYKLFRTSTGEEFDLEVEYDYSTGNSSGNYQSESLAAITGIEMKSTGTGALETGSIEIYPNPAYDLLTININNKPGELTSLSMFDAHGQKIIDRTFANKIDLNVSTFPKGVYYLKLRLGQINEVRKIVIK